MGGSGISGGEGNVVEGHGGSLARRAGAMRRRSVRRVDERREALRTRHTVGVIAEGLLLGDDLIVWLLLALGGALLAGNVMALLKPPTRPRQEGDLEQAPRSRSILMAAIGLVVTLSALGALIRK